MATYPWAPQPWTLPPKQPAAPVGANVGGNPFASVLPQGLNIPGISPTTLQQAWGVINPQLQSAADIINRRSQMGSGYISGLTNFYAQEMGGISGMVGNAYGPEVKSAKNIANWAGTGLTQSGQQQAASVASQMKSAGPLPTSSDLNLTQQGKGAGGAAYGTGISYLDNLIASRAAAQTRAALEPTFASMTGQQQQSMLGAQLARQLADQQSSIMATIPQLLLDLQGRADDKAQADRTYNEQVREYNLNRSDTIRSNQAKIVGPNAPTTQGRLAYWQSVAEQRTKYDPHGYVYEGTTTGIHPVTDKKTGKPIVDPAYTAAVQEGLIKQQKATDDATKAKAARMIVVGSDKTGRYLVDKLTGDRVRLTGAAAPTPTKPVKVVLGDGRIASWNPANNQVTVAGGANPKKQPGTTGTSKYGSAPLRTVESGRVVWVNSVTGKPLGKDGQTYWENVYGSYKTDGRGHMTEQGKERKRRSDSNRKGSSTSVYDQSGTTTSGKLPWEGQ
jgi:hypothetical protein